METVRRNSRLCRKATGIATAVFFAFLALSPAHAGINSTGDVAPDPFSFGDTTLYVALSVGNTFTGSVSIGEGSTLTTLGGAFIGNLNLGTMEVLGTWNDDIFINIGHSSTGDGELFVGPVGTLNGNRVTLGVLTDSEGYANILGTFDAAERLVVGKHGTGSLIIENGGAVNCTNTDWMNSSTIGLYTGSDGAVTVTGAGSTWTNSGTIKVGYQGTGSLIIINGGEVISSAVYGGPGSHIGLNQGSDGTVTVTGAGSTWTNSGYLSVGVRGRGSFTVADGGMVSCNYVLIGFHAIPSYDCSTTGCEGTVTVTGAGSILETTEYHYTQIGMMDGDKGSLIIENGGKVQVRALLIGWDEGSEGVVVVKNATLDVDHDILVACDSYYGSLMGKGSIRLVNGTVIASNIGIGTNGKIVGTGAITGNVFLADGGKISPGLSPGQLTIDGDLNISNGVLDLEANSPSLKDELEVSGNVTIGPEAIFNIVIGFELTDTFDIGDFFFNVLGSFTVDPAFQADQINLFFTADSGMTIGKTVEIMLGGSPFSVVAMAAPQTYVEVPIDIKPGSCPNPLNIKSKGVLPVAILGTEDFDVTDIDPASLRLAGVAPILSSIEDVSTPLLEKQDECDCISEGEDGIDDLTLKFDTQEIISALGEIADGDELVLTLTGELLDGTHIEGEDCIIILSEGKGKK